MSFETQTFHVGHALDLGSVDAAILVHFLVNCISVHKRMGRNERDGRTWNHCSRRELVAHFPYWTEKQIRSRLEELVSSGVLLQANYNKKKYDRTLWLAFADEKRWMRDRDETPPGSMSPICPNGQIMLPKRANHVAQMGTPIPLTTTLPTDTKGNDCAEPSAPQAMPFKSGDLGSEKGEPAKAAQGTPKKRAPRPQKCDNDRRAAMEAGGTKFPLKFDQAPLLEELIDLDPDANVSDLHVVIRSHPAQKILDAIHHVRHEIKLGKKIHSRIAFLRSILKGRASPITKQTEKNKKIAEEIRKKKSWNSLEIHDKFAVCTLTQKELPFCLDDASFLRGIEHLYSTSACYEYAHSD